MKKIILFVGIFSLSLFCPAQVKVSTTSDSVGVDFFLAKIPLATIQPGLNNSSLYTLQGGVDIFFKNKYALSVQLSYSLLDRFFPESKDGTEFLSSNTVTSINKSTPANFAEVRGSYFFKDQIIKQPLKVKLGNRGEEVNLYTEVEGSIRSMQGIRLGVRHGVSWYHLNSGGFETGEKERRINSSDQSTMMRYTQIRVGYEMTTITNLKIQAEGFGKRNASKMRSYYANLIIQPIMNFDDVYYFSVDTNTDDILYSLHSVEESNQEVPVGIEIGSRTIPLAGKIGYHYAIGYAPGLTGNIRLYAEGGFNFYLGKIKQNY